MVREAGEKMGLRFGEEIRERRFPRPFSHWSLRWLAALFRHKRVVYEGENLVENTPQIHRTIRFWRNVWSGLKLGVVAGIVGGLIAWWYATIDHLGASRTEEARRAAAAEMDEDEGHLIRGIRLPFEIRREGIREAYAERMREVGQPERAGLDEQMRKELSAVMREEEATVRDYLTKATTASREAYEATRDEEQLSDDELRRRAGREAMGWNIETVRAAQSQFSTARVWAIEIAILAAMLPLLSAVMRRRMRAGAAVTRATRRKKRRVKAEQKQERREFKRRLRMTGRISRR
jgi:hypothetical protein